MSDDTCTPERCTEADKPMIQRAHTPRTCPAAINN